MASRSPRIVTLTMNPAVDLSLRVDRVRPGQKLRCHDLRRDAGGGGVNVARVVKRLGGRSLAVFPAGGPNGARLAAMLKRERVVYQSVPIRGETREDITVEDLASGDELRFVTPGPKLKAEEIADVLETALEQAKPPAILVASGSLPPGAPLSLYGRLARVARKKGLRLVLDTGGAPLRHALAEGVWLIKPNLAELEELADHPLPDLESRVGACRTLINSGGAELVALSLGSEGALLVRSQDAWFATTPQISPVSTVGAGDGFLAGLVAALARNVTDDVALTQAVACGAAALLAPGTQLCRSTDVQALVARVRVKEITEAGAVIATRSRPAAA